MDRASKAQTWSIIVQVLSTTTPTILLALGSLTGEHTRTELMPRSEPVVACSYRCWEKRSSRENHLRTKQTDRLNRRQSKYPPLTMRHNTTQPKIRRATVTCQCPHFLAQRRATGEYPRCTQVSRASQQASQMTPTQEFWYNSRFSFPSTLCPWPKNAFDNSKTPRQHQSENVSQNAVRSLPSKVP